MSWETKCICQLSPGAVFGLTRDDLSSQRGGHFHHSRLVPQSKALLRTSARLPATSWLRPELGLGEGRKEVLQNLKIK